MPFRPYRTKMCTNWRPDEIICFQPLIPDSKLTKCKSKFYFSIPNYPETKFQKEKKINILQLVYRVKVNNLKPLMNKSIAGVTCTLITNHEYFAI